MKFLGGFITGVVATILVLLLIYAGNKPNETLEGVTMFSEKGECITKERLEIFQTLKPNMALARFGEIPNETLVLLVNYENKSYFDGLKIEITANKCARQIGTFQYETGRGMLKTVPLVVVE